MLRNRNELDSLLRQAFAEGVAGQSIARHLGRSRTWGSLLRRSRDISRPIRLRFKHCLAGTNPSRPAEAFSHRAPPPHAHTLFRRNGTHLRGTLSPMSNL
jgi:hypothetical protein